MISTAGQHSMVTKDIGRRVNNTDVPSEREVADKVFEKTDVFEKGQKEIGLDELDKTVEGLTEYTGWGNFNIDFALDDETNSMVIKIIDRDSGETVRQIPPEQMLNLRSHLRELLGLIFDHMA
ncbi:MAG: flagellar protein FlaG [candidate division Zixibacteria bacterium]